MIGLNGQIVSFDETYYSLDVVIKTITQEANGSNVNIIDRNWNDKVKPCNQTKTNGQKPFTHASQEDLHEFKVEKMLCVDTSKV